MGLRALRRPTAALRVMPLRTRGRLTAARRPLCKTVLKRKVLAVPTNLPWSPRSSRSWSPVRNQKTRYQPSHYLGETLRMRLPQPFRRHHQTTAARGLSHSLRRLCRDATADRHRPPSHSAPTLSRYSLRQTTLQTDIAATIATLSRALRGQIFAPSKFANQDHDARTGHTLELRTARQLG